jgi:hypothetical protein
MSRALIALIVVCGVPLAVAQSAQILIKAKCTFSDGTLVGYQSFVVDASLSSDAKRAAAERACEPVMQEASAKCDELANHVETLKSDWRVAPLHSIEERKLKAAIKQALAAAPAYCKS